MNTILSSTSILFYPKKAYDNHVMITQIQFVGKTLQFQSKIRYIVHHLMRKQTNNDHKNTNLKTFLIS